MSSIEIVNFQRKFKLDLSTFAKFKTLLLSSMPETKQRDFSLAFVPDHRMRELNSFFRGKDLTTDVLSFPHEPEAFEVNAALGAEFLGDIVISVEQAAKQAEENGLTLEGEIKQLILHGLLHLCGHDHETDNGEMNARELELRDELGI